MDLLTKSLRSSPRAFDTFLISSMSCGDILAKMTGLVMVIHYLNQKPRIRFKYSQMILKGIRSNGRLGP